MQAQQFAWTSSSGWDLPVCVSAPTFVLAFGAPAPLENVDVWASLRERVGTAPVLACSTAGEIAGTRVQDDGIVAVAVWLERSRARGLAVEVARPEASAEAAMEIGRQLLAPDLAAVLVFSEGLAVNGSELVRGLGSVLPPHVVVSGGLAGDGADFGRTIVGWDAPPRPRTIAALGLYGEAIEIGTGSMGGWDPFGPERSVTRSSGNVLYTLDHEPALALYKKYLGEHAAALPASALRFPLLLTPGPGEPSVVRTILNVDEASSAMIFAGDIPEGARVRLMKTNLDRLVDGAADAATRARLGPGERTSLAILVSCVGRKLVLRQRVEEEVEAVAEALGPRTSIVGFYSYGEISPFEPGQRCALHNQTMSVTVLRERIA